MSRQKALALVPFISFFAMFAYLCVLKISGDPRFQEPNPEFGWLEHLWGAFTASGVVIVLIRSIWRAFRTRQIGWAVAMFMVWPLAAVYVWKEE